MGRLEKVFVRIREQASRTFPWLSRIQISVCEGCDKEHRAKWRQFAHTNHNPGYVCVARAAVAELTDAELTGMIAHELGHLVAGALRLRAHRTMKPSSTTPASVQREANEISRVYFGIPLTYNKRGIQVPSSAAAAARSRIPTSGRILTNPGLFDKARRELPRCVGGFDPLGHKTVQDLVSLAQHELDLYHEGEENDIRTPKQLAAVKAFVMKYRSLPARQNPEPSQFEFHLKPSGWTGAPCPICGCPAKRLKAQHRALKADEAHRWGATWIKRVKVCFGTDFSDEAIR